MIPQLPSPGQFETLVEPFLLPVKPNTPYLAGILLFNAARRAFARLAASYTMPEPDWTDWLDHIAQARHISGSDLTRPERHVSCLLLESETPASAFVVRCAYRRGYFGELLANAIVYYGFFERHNLSQSALEVLEAHCEKEALLRDLEQLYHDVSTFEGPSNSPFCKESASKNVA